MIVFTLSDKPDMEIIPLQMNILFNRILVAKNFEGTKAPVPDLFSEKWGEVIREYIEGDLNKTYVIDMDGIKGAEKVFEIIYAIKCSRLIYINCNYLIPEYIRGVYKEEIQEIEEHIFADLNGSEYFYNTFSSCQQFNEQICNYYYKSCAQKLSGEGRCKEITLNRSSNIYATEYIDIRKLLAQKNNISIFLYGLYKILQRIDSYDSFVVVSNNGAILANILADFYDKPVLYLLNLGPKIALKDREIKSQIKKGSSYIYIFDFLCLGNEYKTLDMLLKINGAKLMKSIGIAQLLPSDRYSAEENKVESIICLKDYEEIFSYKIACYENELKKI